MAFSAQRAYFHRCLVTLHVYYDVGEPVFRCALPFQHGYDSPLLPPRVVMPVPRTCCETFAGPQRGDLDGAVTDAATLPFAVAQLFAGACHT